MPEIFGEIRSVYIYPHDADPDFRDKILIGGDFFVSSGTYYSPRFARLKADGSLDTTFPQTFIGEERGELHRGAGLRDRRQDPGGRLVHAAERAGLY